MRWGIEYEKTPTALAAQIPLILYMKLWQLIWIGCVEISG